jgi:hypothetical protein
MQGVRGSNPLSSTPGQRPSRASTAANRPPRAANRQQLALRGGSTVRLGSPTASMLVLSPGRSGPPLAALDGRDEGPDRPARQDRLQTRELTSSLSGFSTRLCLRRIAPATWANDVPLATVANRSAPMAYGPNVDQVLPRRHGGPVPLVVDASGAPVLVTRDQSAGRARQGRCSRRAEQQAPRQVQLELGGTVGRVTSTGRPGELLKECVLSSAVRGDYGIRRMIRVPT